MKLKVIPVFFINCIIVLNTACVNTPKEEEKHLVGEFLNFTDLHFTPYYDTTLVEKLYNADFTKWDSIFQTSQLEGFGTYGDEANHYLFTKALKSMREHIPQPDFAIMAGDFICHDFGEKFQRYTGNMNNADMKDFLKKTIKYITHKLKQHYGNIKIFPAMGNNDSYCGDYQVEPNGDFLNMFAELWYPFVNSGTNSTSFEKTFPKGGYYIAENPKNKNHKIIVLNTIFFSRKYQSDSYDQFCDCPAFDQDSLVRAELQWLTEKLEACKQNNDVAWIIMHIPPGIDVYSTMKGEGACEENTVAYWKSEYAQEFLKIINKYSAEIKASMAGHTHMDDFKVIYEQSKPISYVHISPSVSPVFGNNPGYQIVDYCTEKFLFETYETFYVNLSSQADWAQEYDFKEVYKTKVISPVYLDSLVLKMENDTITRNHYFKYYPVSSESGTFVDEANWQWYECGITNILKSDYATCKCE